MPLLPPPPVAGAEAEAPLPPLPPLLPPTGMISLESLAGLLKAAKLVTFPELAFAFCAGAAVPHFGPTTLPGLTAASWRTKSPGSGMVGSVDSSV
jgi:hypothetical protein